jgi:hypothetical protein
VLLAPLWLFPPADFGFRHVAAVSVMFGLAAAAIFHLWRRRRS